MNLSKKTMIIAGVLIYISSAAASYAFFNSMNSSNEDQSAVQPNELVNQGDGIYIDPNEPRDQACPLNGKMYTKTEQAIWATRRPLAVMVENSPDARPHSGIIRADIVYEAIAEGGVTRFMPIFLCDSARSDVAVAPVRSVRTYFIDWASEYGETPLFAHVGGANCSAEKLPNGNSGPCLSDPRTQAIEQLVKYDWRHPAGNDLDQFSIGAKAFIRNESRTGKSVATEHSVVSWTEKLYEVAVDRGWTNLDPDGIDWQTNFTPWKFKDDAAANARGTTTTISYDFWAGYKQYDVRWVYDTATGLYNRFTGGEVHKDLETGTQLFAKNVIVLLTKETGPVDTLKHMLYQTTGSGKALVFMDGNAIEANWSKASRTTRTVFTDNKGQEIAFNRGLTWISVVDTSNTVNY